MSEVSLVSHLMTSNIETIAPDLTLKALGQFLSTRHFRHLPVLEDGSLVGIISRTDYEQVMVGLQLAHRSDAEIDEILATTPVSKLMTKDVRTVTPHTTTEEVMKIFRDVSFHALPVMDDGKLVGIISHHDVFYYV
ncbi:MAG: CBS domain-containing protein [Cyclobacteriaceae bacterium]